MSTERAIPQRIGRYTVERALGEGGMGTVLLAHDEQLGRRVAIKLPRSGRLNAMQRERFEREARAAAAITHPNVCPVFDVGDHEGRPYIAMAYVDGRPLSAMIDPRHPLDQRRAVELALGIANGLAAAHRAGVVHRDVKPLNVVLDERGSPILMDFGLARIVEDGRRRATREGDVLGTPAYMAPEQVDGAIDDIGFHTDVYALGVVLYELLTGRLPFVGSFDTIREEIRRGTPTPLLQHRPEVDPGIEHLCAKAMSVDPLDRFETATEFAAAADGWLNANSRVTKVEADAPGDTVERRKSRSNRTTTTLAPTRRNTTEPITEPVGAPVVRRPGNTVLYGSIAGGAALLLVLGLVYLNPWSARGRTVRHDPPPPKEPGWENVFNGRDIEGWTSLERAQREIRPRPIGEESWVVEEGLLKCVDGEGGMLVLPGTFGVVEIEMEMLLPEGTGLELQLRRADESEGSALRVPIVDGNVRRFFAGTRTGRRAEGERRTPPPEFMRALGEFLAKFDDIRPLLRPAGEWNTIHIRSLPSTMTMEVNGQSAVTVVLADYRILKDLPVVGRIALVTNEASDGIAIRKLRIRALRRGE